ncbi:MAG: EAL domain-containing protein [Glaciecola sp.]|jgi:diguanylate cyclase (GGDEF)-like protein
MEKKRSNADAEQFLKSVLDTLPMRVFWKDTDSNFVGANNLFLKDLKVASLAELIGKNDYHFTLNKKESEAFQRDDREVMESGVAKLGIEEPQSIKGEATRWLRTNKMPLTDKHGKVIGLVGTYEDITEQVNYRKEIELQALIDPLTKLANRRKLQQKIDLFTGECAGLLFIDLDYFKSVNDSLGHFIGDLLLTLVAARLKKIALDKGGLVARLGGDEFSIFVPLENHPQYQMKMAKLAGAVIDELLQPFEVDSHVLNIGASIGITMMTGKDAEYTKAFREADMAMYVAKEKGRGNFQFYNETMRLETERKHLVQQHLHLAIEAGEFSLVFQPQVNTQGDVIGAEALLRWHNAELGMVAPDEFIPLAEETGLIHKLGKWVFESSMETLVRFQEANNIHPDFKLAINVSSKQFRNLNIVSEVEHAIVSRGLSPNNVQIEITESLLIDNKDIAVRSMLKLQSLGVSIAIDDFGTGYSSLAYIANLPIDKLKIDRSFITDLHLKSTNRKLVDTLVNMSKSLHLEVIAEGVENKQERDVLIDLGCSQFQGYLFSQPVPADKLIKDFLA